jgi:hypothetical protein
MLLAPILSQLAGAGLQKVADAVLDKGVEHVEEKLGIKLTPTKTACWTTASWQTCKWRL